jgi:hypothetical protein
MRKDIALIMFFVVYGSVVGVALFVAGGHP